MADREPAKTGDPAHSQPAERLGEDDRMLNLGNDPVTLEQPYAAIDAFTKGEKETRVFLRADKMVGYQHLMELIICCARPAIWRSRWCVLKLCPWAIPGMAGPHFPHVRGEYLQRLHHTRGRMAKPRPTRHAIKALHNRLHGHVGGKTILNRAKHLITIAAAYSWEELLQKEPGIGAATAIEISLWLKEREASLRSSD